MQSIAKPRLVLAEDDFYVSKMIRAILEERGYEVVGDAVDGAEAVKLTTRLKPDAVLMDLSMPVLDGLDATRRIQVECPTPVVILTAYDEHDLVLKACEAGAGAYLIKPPNPSEVDRAIMISRSRFDDLQRLRTLNAQLREAQENIRTLSGLLPICSACHKVRDDAGYWEDIAVFVREHTNAEFSHGLCPDCAKRLYGKYYHGKDENELGNSEN